MKNFFALIGLLVVVLVGVGIWQGWFKFAVNSDQKVVVEVDGKKAGEDVKEGWEKVKEKAEELKKKDDTGGPETNPTAGTPAATPGPLVK
jgi:hypothetical protein